MNPGHSSQDKADFIRKAQYWAMAIDPIHVGAGGERLGHIDLPIVREKPTNLPYIPATGIAGAARYAVALASGHLQCAGKHETAKPQCGKGDCPVCMAFGFGGDDSAMQGLAQFFDARLLFIPVYSNLGTVWVTCDTSSSRSHQVRSPDAAVLAESLLRILDGSKADASRSKPDLSGKTIRLGWLEVPVSVNAKLSDFVNVDAMSSSTISFAGKIADRIVFVPETLFSQIANLALEVRTSVSIDPATGAAADGALFTYEAVPRGSIFAFDVNYNAPRNFRPKGDVDISFSVEEIQNRVERGLKLLEDLGIGGMNTRGFGRIRIERSNRR